MDFTLYPGGRLTLRQGEGLSPRHHDSPSAPYVPGAVLCDVHASATPSNPHNHLGGVAAVPTLHRETKAQKGQMTHPRLQSWLVMDLGFKFSCSGFRACVLAMKLSCLTGARRVAPSWFQGTIMEGVMFVASELHVPCLCWEVSFSPHTSQEPCTPTSK